LLSELIISLESHCWFLQFRNPFHLRQQAKGAFIKRERLWNYCKFLKTLLF
jgi:hypothetical protein